MRKLPFDKINEPTLKKFAENIIVLNRQKHRVSDNLEWYWWMRLTTAIVVNHSILLLSNIINFGRRGFLSSVILLINKENKKYV